MSLIESGLEEEVHLLDEDPVVQVEEVAKVEEVQVEEVAKVEEVVQVEEPVVKVEEVVQVEEKSLSEIISFYKENKSTDKLTSEEFEVLQKIIEKTPTIMDELEKSITEVIKNNNINIHDFPEFIVVVQILYERIYNLKLSKIDNEKCANFCATLLKFIVYVLFEERKINIVEEDKAEFLTKLNNIIDSCSHLLKFPKVLQYEKCCFIC
jgi:hypothetical protein